MYLKLSVSGELTFTILVLSVYFLVNIYEKPADLSMKFTRTRL